jgi:aminopeptidase N
MAFAVAAPIGQGGTYGLFGYSDGILALDEAYPHIPVYDDEGWNAEPPIPNGDITYLDASFYVVAVSAPAHLTLVATGVRIDEQLDGGTQIVTFAAGPARDFYLAASDRFEVTTATVGETAVNSYAFPEHQEHSEYALQVASAALASFSQRFGVYPYTELDILALPMGGALGIEYPGVIGLSLALYDPNAQVSGLPAIDVLESTTAHEVAHQWFYNVVGNDQIDDPWLDEAVVQYATYLYYVDMYGERGAQGYRESWVRRWDRVDGADIPIGMSTGDYDPREYGAIVYGRGPLFVEALAEEMGRDVFDRFLREYYVSHAWSVGTPDSFRGTAEDQCQCDLGRLFEDWVYVP